MTRTINVAHTKFRVKVVDSLPDPDIPTEQLHGYTDLDNREIKLNASAALSADHLKQTLFHELLHAYIYVTGHRSAFVSPDAEEAVVTMLEHMLWGYVNINKFA